MEKETYRDVIYRNAPKWGNQIDAFGPAYTKEEQLAIILAYKADVARAKAEWEAVIGATVNEYRKFNSKVLKEYSKIYQQLVTDLKTSTYIQKLLDNKKINNIATALVKSRLLNKQLDADYKEIEPYNILNIPREILDRLGSKGLGGIDYIRGKTDLFKTGKFYDSMLADYKTNTMNITGASKYVDVAYGKNAYQFSKYEAAEFSILVHKKLQDDLDDIEDKFEIEISL